MKNAGMTSDESANKSKPAISSRKTVAQIFAAEKETSKQEKELIVFKQVKLEHLEQERLEVKKATTEKKTVAKKTTKAAEVVKAVEEVKDVVAEVKEETTKEVEAKPAEVKPVEAKATKTTRASKTTKAAKTVNEKVVLQINGREDLVMSNLIDRVKAAYVEEGNKADSIENIEVYIKLDENMAYYVIDGYASGISLY